MDLDSRPRVTPRVKIAIRLFVRAIHFFVIVVFVLPGACGMITGSDISPPIHSWGSWVVWGVGSVVVAAVTEAAQHLLMRGRRTR